MGSASRRGKAAVEARASERGTSIVECAVLLPFLVTLVLAAVDFSRLSYHGITVASAALAGAHYGSQRVSRSLDLAGMQQVARSEASDLEGVTAQAEQFCECSDGSPIDCTASCGGVSPNVYVRVTVEKTFVSLFPYPGIPSAVEISREAVVRAR